MCQMFKIPLYFFSFLFFSPHFSFLFLIFYFSFLSPSFLFLPSLLIRSAPPSPPYPPSPPPPPLQRHPAIPGSLRHHGTAPDLLLRLSAVMAPHRTSSAATT
uniref:Uncharacterized protein n=1 Tax=Setaria viridis TaxID=4556 RepID=A0A4U6T2P3_SETVI|nr:hypothetical protein SEVIR_9G273900v2 [Setaria viridis]